MNVEKLLKNLEFYRNSITEQTITDIPFKYENEFLTVIKYTSSNKALQKNDKNSNKNGKQWNIIYYPKNNFENLTTWKALIAQSDLRIKITPFRSQKQNNLLAIRIYKMSREPDTQIIQSILDYIFMEKQ